MVEQLIEAGRAARIQRRMVGRWGPRLGDGPRGACATSRAAALIAGRAPAELESMDLAPKPGGRPARGRRARSPPAAADSSSPAADRRLLGDARRSGPGRCSASASSAAATRTRCRPAT